MFRQSDYRPVPDRRQYVDLPTDRRFRITIGAIFGARQAVSNFTQFRSISRTLTVPRGTCVREAGRFGFRRFRAISWIGFRVPDFVDRHRFHYLRISWTEFLGFLVDFLDRHSAGFHGQAPISRWTGTDFMGQAGFVRIPWTGTGKRREHRRGVAKRGCQGSGVTEVVRSARRCP